MEQKWNVSLQNQTCCPRKSKNKFKKTTSNFISYWQTQLPFDNSFLKNVQWIHPEKRLDPGSTSGNSNIALNIERVVKNSLHSLFGVSPSETVKTYVIQYVLNVQKIGTKTTQRRLHHHLREHNIHTANMELAFPLWNQFQLHLKVAVVWTSFGRKCELWQTQMFHLSIPKCLH